MKFSQYLYEGIRTADFERAVAAIVSYLSKTLGTLHKYPSIETYKGTQGSGIGLRYFVQDGTSIRFNWTSTAASSKLDSISMWDGSTKYPNYQIRGIGDVPLGQLSLAKILPTLAKALKNPKVGEVELSAQESTEVYAELDKQLTESALKEDAYDDVVDAIESGPVSGYTFAKMGRNQERIFKELFSTYKDLFTTKTDGVGRMRYTLAGDIEDFDRESIVNAVLGGQVKRARLGLSISPGGDEDTVTDAELQAQRDYPAAPARLPYEEQLEDMKTIINAVAKGASNFAVILGAGGLGKTHTVEETLSELGLEDGNGYFKNTSSGSAAGLYKTLFMNRTGIVVLDDCDTIVSTQEGRNLMKAALDTKKKRKLVWAKAASWLFDPANEEEMAKAMDSIAVGEEPEVFPRYYDFEGRVIMISNLPAETLDPDGALATRGFILTLNPTKDEVFAFMRKIVKNLKTEGGDRQPTDAERMEVIDLIEKQPGAANLRKLVRGLNMCASGVPNWQRIVERYV